MLIEGTLVIPIYPFVSPAKFDTTSKTSWLNAMVSKAKKWKTSLDAGMANSAPTKAANNDTITILIMGGIVIPRYFPSPQSGCVSKTVP